MPREINDGPKIQEEMRTVALMIHLYCKKSHGTVSQLCSSCQQVSDYAMARLRYCQFGEEKTTCKKCPVHCYRKDMKETIREIMRFSGPRMIIYYPLYTIKHYWKGLTKS